jgi:hypothetical protein
MEYKVYQKLSQLVNARLKCLETKNDEWFIKHEQAILDLVKELPSGSGIDCGTKIDLSLSAPDKLVLYVEYHHMNENGYYDGWTEHTIKVVPSLLFGIVLKISGRNRNEIKSYLYEIYQTALTEEIE